MLLFGFSNNNRGVRNLFIYLFIYDQEIRECLKLDPEHKKCFPFYKKVKKVDKLLLECEELSEARDFPGCVAAANKVLRAEDEVTLVVFEARKWLCTCLAKVRTDMYLLVEAVALYGDYCFSLYSILMSILSFLNQ